MIKVPHSIKTTRHGNRSPREYRDTGRYIDRVHILHNTHILHTSPSNISTMGKDKDKQVDALAGIPTDDDAGKC
jgi:hypothetical protein